MIISLQGNLFVFQHFTSASKIIKNEGRLLRLFTIMIRNAQDVKRKLIHKNHKCPHFKSTDDVVLSSQRSSDNQTDIDFVARFSYVF